MDALFSISLIEWDVRPVVLEHRATKKICEYFKGSLSLKLLLSII